MTGSKKKFFSKKMLIILGIILIAVILIIAFITRDSSEEKKEIVLTCTNSTTEGVTRLDSTLNLFNYDSDLYIHFSYTFDISKLPEGEDKEIAQLIVEQNMESKYGDYNDTFKKSYIAKNITKFEFDINLSQANEEALYEYTGSIVLKSLDELQKYYEGQGYVCE